MMNKRNETTVVYGLSGKDKKELARFANRKLAYDSVRTAQVPKRDGGFSYHKDSPYAGYATVQIAPLVTW